LFPPVPVYGYVSRRNNGVEQKITEITEVRNESELGGSVILQSSPTATCLDLSGGWHDAGDYNKYVWGDLELCMVMLMTAYEINPSAFPDGQLLIPGGNNGVPDLLDEVKFEIDWLLKMQMPDGKVLSRVWDDYSGAPDPSPPSKAINPHHYYSPDLNAASIFTGSVAMFARQCAALGDPYGNVAMLKQAALHLERLPFKSERIRQHLGRRV
jgi:hypothetical protein